MEYITETVRDNVKMGRRHLARKLCRDFHFCDPGGKTRTNHCLKALRTLEEKGLVCLKVKGKRLWTEVPKPQEVPERVEQVRGLRLVQVENAEQERVWNELIIREHPLGMGWTGGRRLCYLVESEHGLLGAIGFAPSALHLADREDWIGWNRTQKRIYLERVLNMGRFLIREDAACRNLASRVLSMAVSEFPSDFKKKLCIKDRTSPLGAKIRCVCPASLSEPFSLGPPVLAHGSAKRFALPCFQGNVQGRLVGRTLRVSRRGQKENRC